MGALATWRAAQPWFRYILSDFGHRRLKADNEVLDRKVLSVNQASFVEIGDI